MLDVFTDTSDCNCCNPSILIVGEGNFSFAKDVASHNNFVTIYATSFDSKDTVDSDEQSQHNVNFLKDLAHVTVQHDVDATQLVKYFYEKRFCVIIFNFPHVGGKSNIKKCRKLLWNFFVSASEQLCCNGRVMVSLCRGQGGTPVDIPRRIYGNSWQVIAQASKAGMYLSDILPFDEILMRHYRQAGYRGNLNKGFVTTQGLIHIFMKGSRLIHDPIDIISTEQDKTVLEIVEASNLQMNILMDALDILLTSAVTDILLLHVKIIVDGNNLLPTEIVQKCLKNNFISSKVVACDIAKDLVTSEGKCFHFSYYTYNELKKMLPCQHCISHHVIFTVPKFILNITLEELKIFLISKLRTTLLQNVPFKTITCVCTENNEDNCACIYGENPMCAVITTDDASSNRKNYDAAEIVDFICDLAAVFWTDQKPEITVSSQGKSTDEVKYESIEYDDYLLNPYEKKYFGLNEKANDNLKSCCTRSTATTKLVVKGLCIATITVDHEILTLTFHTNLIFYTCYGVKDLRYLWAKDPVFINHLQMHLDDDSKKKTINHPNKDWKTTLKYPLCYRHDLCFWLDERCEEKQLYTAIRTVCKNLVHSVRLLKVLKHEENNCISYCYRMIYCRIDGPMTREDTVVMQNNLRKLLIRNGFQLR